MAENKSMIIRCCKDRFVKCALHHDAVQNKRVQKWQKIKTGCFLAQDKIICVAGREACVAIAAQANHPKRKKSSTTQSGEDTSLEHAQHT